jgi:hypothetical protein
MLQVLEKLRADKDGFPSPSHPGRINVSPAFMTALKEGIDFYSASDSKFLAFRQTVFSDYASPSTCPETFEKPIYDELKTLLKQELENELPKEEE